MASKSLSRFACFRFVEYSLFALTMGCTDASEDLFRVAGYSFQTKLNIHTYYKVQGSMVVGRIVSHSGKAPMREVRSCMIFSLSENRADANDDENEAQRGGEKEVENEGDGKGEDSDGGGV